MFNLKRERINQDEIDSGISGHVYPYQKDADDTKWVVKRIHANNVDELLSSLPEIVIGFSCDHPCIVPLKGYNIQKGLERDYYVYLKFPRMKESLQERFEDQQRKKAPFSEHEIVQYFYSLVSAVDYLHRKKVYHRDIKPANILVDYQGKVKLCDVGVAKYVGEEEIAQQLTGKEGTVDYAAPEIWQERGRLTKESLRANDVWSVGLVMLELCTLEKRLFNAFTARGKIQEIQEKMKKKLKEIYGEKLVDLIFLLLKVDPKERMEIADVKRKLEEEFRYCKIFEGDSEKDGDNPFKESKRRLKEKYQEAAQEMMVLVEALKQENLKLQSELKDYQFSVKKLQFQISDMSKHYNDTIEKLKGKYQALVHEAVQKNKQDLEKKAQIPPKIEIRIIGFVVGDRNSGRSSFLTRLAETPWRSSDHSLMKVITTQDGKKLRILLGDYFCWKCEDRNFHQRCDVLIALYDITDDKSFLSLRQEIQWFHSVATKEPIVFLLGTKLDLEGQRQVAKLEAEKYAREIGAIHFEVSAKTGENFNVFQEELTRALSAKDWPPEKVRVIEEKKVRVIEEKKVEQKKSKFLGLF